MTKLWYHGGPKRLTKADLAFDNTLSATGAKHGTNSGFGFYLTTDKERAASYGVVTAFEWNEQPKLKELSSTRRELEDTDIIALVVFLDLLDDYGEFALEGPKVFDYVLISMEGLDNDVDVINSLIHESNDMIKTFKLLRTLGYGYTTDADAPHDRIVYDLDQLTIID